MRALLRYLRSSHGAFALERVTRNLGLGLGGRGRSALAPGGRICLLAAASLALEPRLPRELRLTPA